MKTLSYKSSAFLSDNCIRTLTVFTAALIPFDFVLAGYDDGKIIQCQSCIAGSAAGLTPEITYGFNSKYLHKQENSSNGNALEIDGNFKFKLDHSEILRDAWVNISSSTVLTGNILIGSNYTTTTPGKPLGVPTLTIRNDGTVHGNLTSAPTWMGTEFINGTGALFDGDIIFEENSTLFDEWNDRTVHYVYNEGIITGQIINRTTYTLEIAASDYVNIDPDNKGVFKKEIINESDLGGISIGTQEAYFEAPAIINRGNGSITMENWWSGTFDAKIINEKAGTVNAFMREPEYDWYTRVWLKPIYNNGSGTVNVDFYSPYFEGWFDNGSFKTTGAGKTIINHFIVDDRHALTVAGDNTWNISVKRIQVNLSDYSKSIHVRDILHGSNDNWQIALEDKSKDYAAKSNGSVNNGRGIFTGDVLTGPITGPSDFVDWSKITEDRIDDAGYIVSFL